MSKDFEAELKRVEADAKSHPHRVRRDPSMTGGERAETPAEKTERRKAKAKPPRAPIIQRTP